MNITAFDAVSPSMTCESEIDITGGWVSLSTMVPGALAVWALLEFVAVNTNDSASASKTVSSATGTFTVWTSAPPGVKVSAPLVLV